MEASLTCAVCLGVFREPVTLPRCSHNFCKSCVLDCAAPQRSTGLQLGYDQGVTVTCPLCRKVSALSGGLAALTVNTTLAEVVRLLPQNGKVRESPTAGAMSGSPDGGISGRSPCAQHPEYRLELFCKSCEQACCGKCVSLRHQGIFHAVNLQDMIFQEEKLVFFNSLKSLREINERLKKEVSEDEKNAESILKANEDAIAASFDEVQNALNFKKEQLLDLVKQQRSAAKKRNEVRNVTKAHQKTTVERLLKDCENIVDDYNPSTFLKVACGLNKRMKSNIELMEFCADHSEDVSRSEPQCVDVRAVLDAVSALKIASSSKDPRKENGSFSFKSISRTWDPGMATNEKYCPVQDQELIYLQGQLQKLSIRYVCITKMPAYHHLSSEELRLTHYEPSVVVQDKESSASERQGPFVYDVGGFNFSMPGINPVKTTRLKKHDGFNWKCADSGKKHVFKEKSPKKDDGRMELKYNLCAVPVIRKDNIPVVAQDFPSSSLGGLTNNLTSDIKMEKTPELCNDLGNKALFPHFCVGKSEITTIKKSGRNEKACKKMKSAASAPKVLSAGSVASTSMADRSASAISSVGTEEEDMSVSSSSSEEFYDASCNIDPDVVEPCEQSSNHNSAGADES